MARQPTVSSDAVAHDQLRAFFDRIERLHEERASIGDDIKEVFAEAKGNGFDTKVMKIVLAKRRQDVAERMEQEALVDLYMHALGMAVASFGEYEDETGTENANARAPAHATPNPAPSIPHVPVGGPTEAQPLSAAEEGADPDSVPSAPSFGPEAGDATPEAPEANEQGGNPVGANDGQTVVTGGESAATNIIRLTNKPRRPWCQNPERCSGYGPTHCGQCQKLKDSGAPEGIQVEAGGKEIQHGGQIA